MTYKFARFLVHTLMRLVVTIEVHGIENLPATGGYIAAANHLGRLDPGLVYSLLDRQDIIMLVAEKYRRFAILRWLVKSLEGIWVDRFNADFAAMRNVLGRLRKGGALIMAPEGTRSPTGALLEGRAGASYLAARAGVPVLPVAVTGTEDQQVKKNLRRLKRTPVTIRVGEPFSLPPLGKQERDALLQQYTAEIMCRIAALLPPAYRGFYAEHPRLRELLETKAFGN
ncbi:MAG TPA: lysophospholipid acyltransferase family protein [Anaerolineales bacterium]|nr:lysophospholipid acyltransferase family protein [Anaerolineales bacterium]